MFVWGVNVLFQVVAKQHGSCVFFNKDFPKRYERSAFSLALTMSSLSMPLDEAEDKTL